MIFFDARNTKYDAAEGGEVSERIKNAKADKYESMLAASKKDRPS